MHSTSDLRLGKWLDEDRDFVRIRNPGPQVLSGRLIIIHTGGVVRMNLPEPMVIKGPNSDHK